jgi:hypothetical protein
MTNNPPRNFRVRDPITSVFLRWLADRLVFVYGESENVDFVRRLQFEANEAEIREDKDLAE